MNENEINLRDYWEIINKRKRFVMVFIVMILAIVLLLSILQKPGYEAKVTLLIRGNTGGMISQFSGLAGLAGINLAGASGNIQDLDNLIKSDAVAERVLDQLKLMQRIPDWNELAISRQRQIIAVRDLLREPRLDGNMMEIKVEYSDPQLAAEIANGFVDSLTYYWNKMNYTEAKKKREYIESQLPRVEADLKTAEEKYKRFTRLAPQRSAGANSSLLGMALPAQSQGIELTRLQRELDIQNNVYTMLRREYEQVKLDESKEMPPFSVVDRASKPEFRSRPRIKLNLLVGLTVGLFAGTFLAFFQEYWEGSEGGKA